MPAWIPYFTVTTFDRFPPPTTCEQCCPWAFSAFGVNTGGAPVILWSRRVVGCRPQDMLVSVTWDFFGYITNVFHVRYYAGSTIFTTGCNAGSGSSSFTIPAGNTTIEMIIEAWCSPPYDADDQYSVTTVCG